MAIGKRSQRSITSAHHPARTRGEKERESRGRERERETRSERRRKGTAVTLPKKKIGLNVQLKLTTN